MLQRTIITVGIGFLGGWIATLFFIALSMDAGFSVYGDGLITDGSEDRC